MRWWIPPCPSAGSGNVSADLPDTFVPGRNLVFLTFAAAFAWQRGIRQLVTGVAQTDYSGYPDCRAATISSLQQTLSLGMEADFTLHTPLMNLSKAQTVTLAAELGALPAMALTHTCYNGQRPPCGECPACELRAKGFAEAGVADPLLGRMTYSVKEIYYTLQGEGAQTGRPAVFLRFAGCNLWSGREADRDSAVCRFCDTDFVGVDGPGGGKFPSATELAGRVADANGRTQMRP